MEYEQEVRVPFFLGTQADELSLAMMVNVMLAVSEVQLEQAGAGVAELAAENAGWVITQYHLDITAIPRVDTPLIVGTRAVSYNKLMTYRDYWINAADGTRLVTMSGAWVMMDLTARKIMPMLPTFPEKVGAVADTHVKRYPRLKKADAPTISLPYRVRYFDIDSNRHVNNAHYMEWMEDSLGAEFLQAHRLTSVDIKYAREVRYGTTVHAEAEIDGELTRHQVVTDGVVNAEANFGWTTR